jgi:hypothetical protein
VAHNADEYKSREHQLLAHIAALQAADERRFVALSAQLETLQSERRAEYAQLAALVQGMLATRI